VSSPGLDQFAHPLSLVRAEVVQYDYLPGRKRERQYSFDVGLEDNLRGSSLHSHRPVHARGGHACQQRGVLPAVAGHAPIGQLAFGRSGVAACHRGVRPAFVDEHEPVEVESPYLLTPARSFGLVAFAG
jgi:hypothetical protein